MLVAAKSARMRYGWRMSSVSPRSPETPTSSVPAERRARKKSKTRADLLAAGTALFASRGFDETTTNDIAEAADVSQRTLFRHFATKEALLYGDMDEALDELRAGLAGRPSGEPVFTSLRRSLVGLAGNFEAHREGRLLQARLAAEYPSVSAYSRATVQLSWERAIIEGLAERLGEDPMLDPRPEIIAGATMSAVRIATRQWVASGGRADFVALVDAAMAVIPHLGELDLEMVRDSP